MMIQVTANLFAPLLAGAVMVVIAQVFSYLMAGAVRGFVESIQ